MAFPPPPRSDLDWSLPMNMAPANGHIQCRWSHNTGVWSEPQLVRDPYLKVHGLAPVFNYGQEAYEGLKAFRSPGDRTINIARPNLHAKRLQHSASLVSIPPIPESLFLRAVNLVVAHNAEFVPPHSASAMLYIRPVVIGTGAWVALNPPTGEYLFCVYVVPAAAYHGTKPVDALILEDFDRAAPRGTGSGKVGGNYAPVIRWSEAAKKEGFPLTLHLDSQTRTEIEEFSTSAFVGIKRGCQGEVRVVLPDTGNVVQSVTSRTVEELAQALGWDVERRSIKYEELPAFTEVIACGTAVSVLPVRSITRKSTSDKFAYMGERCTQPGPVAAELARMIEDIHKGRVEDALGWMVEVQDPTANDKVPETAPGYITPPSEEV